MIRLTLRSAIAAIAIAVSALPAAIQKTSAADVFYVTMSDNTVRKFDTDGNALGIFASAGLADPRGLAFDASGGLYVANYGSKMLSKYDSAGNYLPAASIDTGSLLSNFNVGVAIDSSGAIYVSHELSRVRKFDAAGNLLALSPTSNTPTALAFSAAGNLLVANRTGNTISSYDTGLNSVAGAITTDLNRPRGLAVDSFGNVYAANSFTDDISKFSSSGTFLGRIGNSTNLNNPYGLAFDSQGYLYVASEQSRTIAKFAANGGFVTSWSTGSISPRFIAFETTTVPEPGSMALAAISVGVAVIAKRRGRNRYA